MGREIPQIIFVALLDIDGGSVTFDRVGLVEDQKNESGIRRFQGTFYLYCVVMTADRLRKPPDGSEIEESHALLGVAFCGIILVTEVNSDPVAHDSSLLFEEYGYRCGGDNQWLETRCSVSCKRA